MRRIQRRLLALGDRRHPDETPSEAFTRSLFTGRVARTAVGVMVVLLAVAVAWTWNAVSAAAGLAAGLAVTAAVVGAVVVLDGSLWRGQDVVLWQQAGRERRWREDTGGPSPILHPAQAETWLGTHPRGTVPQLYRVLAASLARDDVVRERELAAFVPSSATEAAWREWAIVAPRAMEAQDVDLGRLRTAVTVLPAGDDRRQLEASIVVVEALRRHHLGERTWPEPLVTAWTRAARERLPVRQVLQLWLRRLAIVLGFVVPCVALAASGLGTPEPYPAAYRSTTVETRGPVGDGDGERLLAALPALASDVAAHAPIRRVPMGDAEWAAAIDEGLPTLLWHVGALDLAGPPDVTCGDVTMIEVLLGAPDPAGGAAIVTCAPGERLFLVPIQPGTVAGLRAALGLSPGR